MILPLDHLIFGNGWGMKTPHCDGKFYWLSGQLYHWSGWFGAQLRSTQWTHPKPGERRRLLNREFKIFHSGRAGFPIPRVECSWSLVGLPAHDINVANAMLRELRTELDAL